MDYLSEIAEGHTYSPRVPMFESGQITPLAEFSKLWVIDSTNVDEELEQYIVERSRQLRRYRELTGTQRLSLHMCVLIPEIVAFIIHKEDSVPLMFARRILNEDPLYC
eukprot:gene20687-22725_t